MVASRNRFKRSKPCPICGGFDSQERGRGKRCHGFLSEDGQWAHCTREDSSGGLHMFPQSKTFAHKLFGNCNCGIQHNPEIQETMKDNNNRQYDYTDEQGEVLYQVCRAMPKTFFQRRPDGNGGWIKNLDGVRRVLYRFPEVVAADESATVFVCEGEKDVDALRALGLVATTNSGGAGKWRSEYNEALKGRHVVILPDNDQPGREHAEQVVKFLSGIAASVRIVKLPGLSEKGDVSDWLKNGGTVEQLQELVMSPPERSPSLVEGEVQANDYEEDEDTGDGWICAADVKSEYVEWLWKPYIALGKITLFDGDPGVGKSWATCAIAAAVSRGYGLPEGLGGEARTVLMLSAEDGLGDTIRPRLETLGADLSNIILRNKAITFDEEGLKVLEAKVAESRPSIVIIDPLFAFVGGKVNIYKDNEVRAILTPIAAMAEKYHCAFIALRHLTKQQQKAIYAGGGSMAFLGAARSALLFGCDSDNPNVFGFVHAKSNLAPKGTAVGYKIERTEDERGRFNWVSECDLTAEKIIGSSDSNSRQKSRGVEAEEFLCEILKNGPQLAEEIERQAKRKAIALPTLQRAKKNLEVESFRVTPGVGKWWWRLPDYREYEADSHRPLLSNEYVVVADSSSSPAIVKADTHAVGGDNVHGESIHSNDNVLVPKITPVNSVFTDIKADTQNGALVGGQQPLQNPADKQGSVEDRATMLDFEGEIPQMKPEDLTARPDTFVRVPVQELFG